MAKVVNYCPAGFEFNDYSDDDCYECDGLPRLPVNVYDPCASLQKRTDTANKAGVTANSNDANQDDDEFNSDFVWNIEEEFHSNPVIELPGKSLFNSSVILLDDFRHAAIRNSTDVLEKFLQHVGVDIESRLKSGWTVLMHAAYAAKPDSVRCLLKHGADPNAHKNDTTVLMVACGSASRKYDDVLNCIDQLLDKEAQVNAYNSSHMSPLMYAARCGYTAVVQRLIEKQADLNEQDNLGYTALMHAVEKGHIGVVRVLLKTKADVGKQTLEGNDAMYLAFIGKHEQLQKMLENDAVDEELGCSDLDKTELVAQREDLSEDQLGWSKTAICDSYTLTNFDLLLSGLQLNELKPIFQERNISYEKFLRLTDADLIEMGIHQLGVRKKILDALQETHKKNWETSSLTPVDYNRKITCLDSTGLVANVHFHALYIASTVGYISDQLSADKDIVLKAPEKEVTDLCINAEETIVNVKNLYEELHILNTRLAKICRYHDFSPPDFIKPNTNSRIAKRRLTLAAVVICGFMTAAWLKLGSAVLGRL